MRLAARTDANQREIVNALRSAGYSVCILSAVGKGVPDLLVGAHGVNILFEVKDGAKPKSARKLTVDEAKWHEAWKGTVFVVESITDALSRVKQVSQRSRAIQNSTEVPI